MHKYVYPYINKYIYTYIYLYIMYKYTCRGECPAAPGHQEYVYIYIHVHIHVINTHYLDIYTYV
jgi:hypothetical protein